MLVEGAPSQVQLLAPPLAAPPVLEPPEAAPPVAATPPAACVPPVADAPASPVTPPVAAPPLAVVPPIAPVPTVDVTEDDLPPVTLELDFVELTPPLAVEPPLTDVGLVTLVPPDAVPPAAEVPAGAPPRGDVTVVELSDAPPNPVPLDETQVLSPCPDGVVPDWLEQAVVNAKTEQTASARRETKVMTACLARDSS